MRFLLALLFVAAVTPALALDGSAGVKATPLLKSTTSWDGKALAWPAGEAEGSMLLIEIAPGAETGWHSHPVPSFAYVLEGELEVSLQDGRKNRLQPGQALAEVVGVLHNGRNVGQGPVKLVVFYAASKGQALTQKPQP
ncbi:cupin domain-containing protein [Tahibacter harae]|uniref:Cupin domain-containing protein n=1 Tax=Tahibacter harae TaxID=2963937 RepID=A0ABT1QY85_9GAMM|nr:cupin domain-containing protein [Tahibacter harae]MCQ4167259.1 cupin domain-containing protein [Tahibacter harae]